MDKKKLIKNPLATVKKLQKKALKNGDASAGLCFLATIDELNSVHVRTIELDEIEDDKLLINISRTSPKWKHLQINKDFEILLLWLSIPAQIRIKGRLRESEKKITEKKWQKTAHNYKILDWYHSVYQNQSSLIKSSKKFKDSINILKKKYPKKNIKIPDTVVGLSIYPERIEIWKDDQKDGIPERILFELINMKWKLKRLVP